VTHANAHAQLVVNFNNAPHLKFMIQKHAPVNVQLINKCHVVDAQNHKVGIQQHAHVLVQSRLIVRMEKSLTKTHADVNVQRKTFCVPSVNHTVLIPANVYVKMISQLVDAEIHSYGMTTNAHANVQLKNQCQKVDVVIEEFSVREHANVNVSQVNQKVDVELEFGMRKSVNVNVQEENQIAE